MLLKLNPEAYQEEWEDGLDNLPPVPEYFCRTHKDLCSEEYCAYLREDLRSPYFNEEAAYYCRQHDAHCEIDCPHIDEALNPRQETRSEARYRCDLHSRRPCKATCLLIKLLIDEDELYAENNALFLCREHRKYCAATDCSHIEGLPFSYADQKEDSDDDNYDDEDDEPPSLEEINTALAWATSIDDKTNQGLLTEEEAFLAGVDAAMKEGGILLDVVTTLRTQLVPYPYDQNWPTLRAATLGFYELYADNEDLSQMLNQGHADHDLTGDTSLPPLDDYGHWPTLRASILDFYGLPESGNLNKVLTLETESKEVPNNDPDSNGKPESLKRAAVSNLHGVATPNLEPKDPPVTSTLVQKSKGPLAISTPDQKCRQEAAVNVFPEVATPGQEPKEAPSSDSDSRAKPGSLINDTQDWNQQSTLDTLWHFLARLGLLLAVVLSLFSKESHDLESSLSESPSEGAPNATTQNSESSNQAPNSRGTAPSERDRFTDPKCARATLPEGDNSESSNQTPNSLGTAPSEHGQFSANSEVSHHHTPDISASSEVSHHQAPDISANSEVSHHQAPDIGANSEGSHHLAPDISANSEVSHHQAPESLGVAPPEHDQVTDPKCARATLPEGDNSESSNPPP